MSNVVGLDGHVPVYDPEARWTIWGKGDVYFGEVGLNRFVPKVNDYIIDPVTYETWIVDYLDPLTLIPTIRAVHPSGMSMDLTVGDALFGVGVGQNLETYRAFLNDSTNPYTLSLDQRFMPKGTLSSYCKIFLGRNTEADGEVISKVYDAGGNFISNSVALEMVALDSHTNYAVKQVKRCHITKKLPNGEVITAVVYADDGHVVERRQFLIENTDTIADMSASTKYIEEISLESIWLNQTSPDLLEYPLNIPMDALNLIGVVHYSDGTTAKYPVDGTKFTMIGLDGRASSTMDPDADLVLRYFMSSSESAYASTGVNGRYITKPYRLRTVNTNNSISVKLFGFPFWVNAAFGWRIRWFLLNMARNVYFEVTEHVSFDTNMGPYDPKLYGYLQRKSVSINLRNVSQSFIPFIHTQAVDIILNSAATNDPVGDWVIRTISSDSNPGYGRNVYGRKQNNFVNFTSGHASFASWLADFYEATLPLFDASVEVSPPTPTHFEITYGTIVTEWPIENWNQNLYISTAVSEKTTAIFRFFKRTANGDLSLGYGAALIKSI